MKLNCDMGESFGAWHLGNDTQIMPYIDMSNIACGFHASDPQVMAQTIKLAQQHDVAIGAHPGYPDLQGFGRKAMLFTFDELVNIVVYQVGALQALCAANNVSVSYVKPHGALYNTMMTDSEVYRAVLTAVASISPTTPLMIMATDEASTQYQQYTMLAQTMCVPLLFEAFCDRAYTDEGLLQSRKIDGAVYDDVERIVSQAEQLIAQQSVTSCTGKKLKVKADSLCIHGDGALALPSVKRIREILAAL
ncbi:5-oxoprolinase subunit PxpA [Eionea flava]